MSRAAVVFLTILLATTLGVSCRSDRRSPVSLELEKLTAGKTPAPIDAAVRTDVLAFYKAREWAPVWIDNTRVAKRAAEGLKVLTLADAHGLRADRYQEPQMRALVAALEQADRKAPDRVPSLANLELRLTSALMALGRDVAIGRGKPESVEARWKRQRKPPDLATTLDTALKGDLEGWLETLQPPHPEYVTLQKALASLRARQRAGGWPAVPKAKFKAGQRHDAIVVLRERLRASGDLTTDSARDPRLFDDDVARAVTSFQSHHGLPPTGAIESLTLTAMNVPLYRRVAQIEINLERWRWMPDDLGDNHLLVNIPAYLLIVSEHGQVVRDIRVVIGKIGNETPIFSDEMTTVVFSPYWNIPETIVQDETVPAMDGDSDYLANNDIEIIRTASNNEVVDPSTIDWDDVEETRGLSFRQRPGPHNALGHVKFLFPNTHNVYLHDTPADSYFSRRSRAFSHGCVRIEEPEVLAAYMLRHQREWTGPSIAEAMHSGVEREVALPGSVPIHIAYFTAWVDPNGGLHFRDDVYGYDEKQFRGWPSLQ